LPSYSLGFLQTDTLLNDNSHLTVIPSGVSDCLELQSVYLADNDPIPLVFDSGATIGISPLFTDFESWETPSAPLQLHGIEHASAVKGVGTVCWTVRDDKGLRQTIRTRAYYVPA
jgi:hypothetical protein